MGKNYNQRTVDRIRKHVGDDGFSITAGNYAYHTDFKVTKTDGHYVLNATDTSPSFGNGKENAVNVEIFLDSHSGLAYKISGEKCGMHPWIGYRDAFSPISIKPNKNSLDISCTAGHMLIRNSEGSFVFEVHEKRLISAYERRLSGFLDVTDIAFHVRVKEDKSAENGFSVEPITTAERLGRLFNLKRTGIVEIQNSSAKLKVPA